jgi:hypothetical protein
VEMTCKIGTRGGTLSIIKEVRLSEVNMLGMEWVTQQYQQELDRMMMR